MEMENQEIELNLCYLIMLNIDGFEAKKIQFMEKGKYKLKTVDNILIFCNDNLKDPLTKKITLFPFGETSKYFIFICYENYNEQIMFDLNLKESVKNAVFLSDNILKINYDDNIYYGLYVPYEHHKIARGCILSKNYEIQCLILNNYKVSTALSKKNNLTTFSLGIVDSLIFQFLFRFKRIWIKSGSLFLEIYNILPVQKGPIFNNPITITSDETFYVNQEYYGFFKTFFEIINPHCNIFKPDKKIKKFKMPDNTTYIQNISHFTKLGKKVELCIQNYIREVTKDINLNMQQKDLLLLKSLEIFNASNFGYALINKAIYKKIKPLYMNILKLEYLLSMGIIPKFLMNRRISILNDVISETGNVSIVQDKTHRIVVFNDKIFIDNIVFINYPVFDGKHYSFKMFPGNYEFYRIQNKIVLRSKMNIKPYLKEKETLKFKICEFENGKNMMDIPPAYYDSYFCLHFSERQKTSSEYESEEVLNKKKIRFIFNFDQYNENTMVDSLISLIKLPQQEKYYVYKIKGFIVEN